jgi:hypothetical protein
MNKITGENKGEAQAIILFLQARFGDVSQAICDKVHTVNEQETLHQLVATAAKCRSLDEFNMELWMKTNFSVECLMYEKNPLLTDYDELSPFLRGVISDSTKDGMMYSEVKSIIRTLRKRFQIFSPSLFETLFSLRDLEKLEHLADFAFDCTTIDEFEQALK